jgi:hypothetical protein
MLLSEGQRSDFQGAELRIDALPCGNVMLADGCHAPPGTKGFGRDGYPRLRLVKSYSQNLDPHAKNSPPTPQNRETCSANPKTDDAPTSATFSGSINKAGTKAGDKWERKKNNSNPKYTSRH